VSGVDRRHPRLVPDRCIQCNILTSFKVKSFDASDWSREVMYRMDGRIDVLLIDFLGFST